MFKKEKIDVHHHMVPDFYATALKSLGVDAAAGAPLPNWTPDNSLTLMDAAGIACAYLSISCPGVFFGDAGAARELARQCNEYGSALKQQEHRFGYFATVSQTIQDDAVLESCHALDDLNADGVTLLSSVDGLYLGHPVYLPLMEELNRREAIVFVHPNLHKSVEQIQLEMPGYMIEFVFDTTRAVANLITSGTLERFPKIRFILSHAGGTVPYLAWRMQLADFIFDKEGKFPRGTLHYLKQFYYDTALSPSPFMWGALRELVGDSRILFGSDFPFAPDLLVHAETGDLASLDMSENQFNALYKTNAQLLFDLA